MEPSGENHDHFKKNGDQIATIQRILDKRGSSIAKVANIKGHATDEMVADGTVRWQDKGGNEAADRAAHLCRIRQPGHIMDARRRIQNASSFWYCHSL